MQERQVRFLGGEDPLEEEMATHSSVLAWENPRDRGAWQTTVHGVVESQIGLKHLSTAAPVSAEWETAERAGGGAGFGPHRSDHEAAPLSWTCFRSLGRACPEHPDHVSPCPSNTLPPITLTWLFFSGALTPPNYTIPVSFSSVYVLKMSPPWGHDWSQLHTVSSQRMRSDWEEFISYRLPLWPPQAFKKKKSLDWWAVQYSKL